MLLSDYLTTAQAAIILRLSQTRVRVLCEGGRIPGASRVGPIWLIPRCSVEDFSRLKRPAGNPNFRRITEILSYRTPPI